jgi:lysophospholipase L1-like esterase
MKILISFFLSLLLCINLQAQTPVDTADLRTKINAWIVPNGNKQVSATQVNQLMNGITNLMTRYSLNGAYRVADTLFLTGPGLNTVKVTLNSGGVSTETDPSVPSAIKALNSTDVTRWNGKQDHFTPIGQLSLIANVLSVNNNAAAWNANKLQGRNIVSTPPAIGQVLKWNGVEWAPAPDDGPGGSGLPGGGSPNQLLIKNSGTDGDAGWLSATKNLVGLNNVQNVDQTNAVNVISGVFDAARIPELPLLKIAQGGATNGQVLKYIAGIGWAPGVDNSDSSGGSGLPGGGSPNQLLIKNSGTDGDAGWLTPTKSIVGLSNVQNVDQTNADNVTSGIFDIARIPGIPLTKFSQSSATTGQVPKWNGSAWAPAPDDTGGGSGITSITGDISASGTGSVAGTIQANAVNSAKIQDGAVSNSDLANSTIGFNTPGSTGTAPNWSASTTALGAASTLNIPLSSAIGVTAGLLPKSKYDEFDAKLDFSDTAQIYGNVQGRGAIFGNSTVASYFGQNNISVYLRSECDVLRNTPIDTFAVPGHSINQQKAIWDAIPDKTIYDWIVVEIGLNDMQPAEAASVAIARLQAFINDINASKKTGALVFVATMTPAKQRWYNTYGSTDAALAQAKWVAFNQAVTGGGSTPITGVSARISQHTTDLGDGTGNLAAGYDMGDGIHPNNAGREIIGNSWRAVINNYGYLTCTGFTQTLAHLATTSSGVSVTSGQLAVGTGSGIIAGNVSNAAGNLELIKNGNADVIFEVENGSSGSNATATISVRSNSAQSSFSATPSTFSTYGVIKPSSAGFYQANPYYIALDGNFDFSVGAGNGAPEVFKVDSSGVYIKKYAGHGTGVVGIDNNGKLSWSAGGGSSDWSAITNGLGYTNTANGARYAAVTNSSTGTGATAGFFAANSTSNMTLGMTSTGFSTYGALVGNVAYEYSGENIVLMADGANKYLSIAAGGNTETVKFTTVSSINYLNFGGSTGSSGYGIRDSAGIMQYKNTSGIWVSINSSTGGGGSSQWTLSGTDLYPTTGTEVGIGTTAPTSLLHVYKNTDAANYIKVENTHTGASAQAGISLINDGGTSTLFTTSAAASSYGVLVPSAMGIYTPNKFFIGIDANQSFAIGTGSGIAQRFGISGTGVLTVNGLATGGATEMVTVDASGNFSRAAIPSGGGGTSSDLTGGAIKANLHIVLDADYTVASTDYIIIYKTLTTGRTLTLPDPALNTNRMLIIKHGGQASDITSSRTIRQSSTTTTTTIVAANQSATIISDGSEWWFVNLAN